MGISAVRALSGTLSSSKVWGAHAPCLLVATPLVAMLLEQRVGEGSAPSPVREGTRALQKLKMARYGDFFGDTDGEVLGGAVTGTPDAPAPGVGAASPGFALNSSTSKIRVAFGPMSPPAPLGP
jgi:hypothetical protein